MGNVSVAENNQFQEFMMSFFVARNYRRGLGSQLYGNADIGRRRTSNTKIFEASTKGGDSPSSLLVVLCKMMVGTQQGSIYAVLRLAILFCFIHGHHSLSTAPRQTRTSTNANQRVSLLPNGQRNSVINLPCTTKIFATGNKDDELVETSSPLMEGQENFDAKGFGNYLAPYAAAVFCSIAMTAAFLKFVLLDY